MVKIIRKLAIIGVLLGLWEIAARMIDLPLILPGVLDTFGALVDSLKSGDDSIIYAIGVTMKALLMGFGIGALIATVLTVAAVNTKIGEEFFSTITSGFAPLPAVAISPVFMLIWGLSFTTIVATAAFAATFPLAVNMLTGFRSVSETMRFVGMNFGMTSLGITCRVLIPASLSYFVSGARSSFSNGVRALIAVEMISAVSGKPGIGYFLMMSKQGLEIPTMYASLLCIMLIGLSFEAIFDGIESITVKKWGMKS